MVSKPGMIAVCCGFRVFAALLGSWGLRRLPPHAQTRLSSRWGALISGAPIRAGGASPLRVATGRDANWRFKARLRRSPASTNRRRGGRLWIKSPIESGSPRDSIPGLLTTKSVLVCSPRDTLFIAFTAISLTSPILTEGSPVRSFSSVLRPADGCPLYLAKCMAGRGPRFMARLCV